MLYARMEIQRSLKLLTKYSESTNMKTDLQLTKTRMKNEIDVITRALLELNLIMRDNILDSRLCNYIINDMKTILGNIDNYEDSINALPDMAKIIAIIEPIIDFDDKYSPYSMRYSEYSNMVYKNTSLQFKEINNSCCSIFKNMADLNRQYNVLYIDHASSQIAMGFTNDEKANVYATTSNPDLYKSLKIADAKVIKSVGSTTISNDVFDIVVCQPRISWNAEYNVMDNLKIKLEKAAIFEEIKYLRVGGVFAYVIPAVKLTKDIAWMLSKYIENVNCYKVVESDVAMLVVTGLRKAKGTESDGSVYNFLSNAYDNIESLLREPTESYSLPIGIQEIKMFRGTDIDSDEALSMIKSSNSLDTFFQAQLKSTVKQESRPLLPFNVGQIGLILTSGCLDGLVKEYEGQHHLIKGRVSKVTTKSEEVVGASNVITETINNRVQVNIFTPSGDYIELA